MSTRRSLSEMYLINIKNYEVIRNINHGGFGTINLVRNKDTGEQYAAKTNLIQGSTQNKLFISREVRILMKVQHPTIIRLQGFSYEDFEGKKNITILMDYMKEGSLANLIDQESKSLAPSDYDNTKRQIILVGIARGMMLLHALHIIHRDLKPENILLDSDFQPHITDFGLSKFFDPHHSMNQSMSDAGTAAYMAPEVIESNHFNTKADVYAFGILMYEVISGRRAYGDILYGRKRLTDYQFKTKVREGLRPNFDFPIKKGLKKMIESCWSSDPKLRPTFEEIFKKLSLSSDDYILEFDSCNEEPKIILDDDDEDEDEGEDEEIDIGLVLSKKFCIENVITSELLDYVDDIKVGVKNDNDEMKGEIEKIKLENKEMKEEMKKIKLENKEMKEEMKKIKLENEEMKKKTALISSIQAEPNKAKSEKDAETNSLCQSGDFISSEMSATEPGILSKLAKKQKSPFDKLFIASQSSSDIYSLLVPDSEGSFGLPSKDSFIEIEFENSISICGIKIFSINSSFPRTFDISVDGKTVKSINDAAELNGKYKNMTVKFSPVKAQKVRFTNKGKNWDTDSYQLYIKGIELLSTESKYSRGVFATLVNESENKDPHKCPVFLSASYFDLNNFYLIDNKKYCATYDYKNSWFQIELTRGMAILTGFRLKRNNNIKLKNYKIIATDDSKKPESSWTTLIQINEKSINENDDLHFFRFQNRSPPVKFIKIVSTGPNWNDSNFMYFCHFDFFGLYF